MIPSLGTIKSNDFNPINGPSIGRNLLAGIWGVIRGNSDLCEARRHNIHTDPLSVEQEVGGSSPPNCTSQIKHLSNSCFPASINWEAAGKPGTKSAPMRSGLQDGGAGLVDGDHGASGGGAAPPGVVDGQDDRRAFGSALGPGLLGRVRRLPRAP